MNCTFFGHRDAPSYIKPLLQKVISDLIEYQNVKHFRVGNQGNFDSIAHSLLSDLEQIHGISYEVVLAYIPKIKYSICDTDPTIIPEGIETVPRRFAIEYRNSWMLDHSDIVITYVTRSFGGAAKFKELAVKKNKIIVEISKIEYSTLQF